MDYKNKTALITGASSGIGLKYAEEFAKRGCNLILVARREDELKALASRLETENKISAHVIVMDLATLDAGATLMNHVADAKLDVDFLVNNAGFGTSGRLEHEDRPRIQKEIVLNIATLTDLTAAVLPSMLAKNSGAIINIASTASFQPVPGMAVYAATKAYVRSFTQAVWGELTDTNIKVLSVSPGATATEFFDVAGAKPSSTPAPSVDVVNQTFKALDAKNSPSSIVIGGRNSVMAALSSRLPIKMVIGVAAKMFLPARK